MKAPHKSLRRKKVTINVKVKLTCADPLDRSVKRSIDPRPHLNKHNLLAEIARTRAIVPLARARHD